MVDWDVHGGQNAQQIAYVRANAERNEAGWSLHMPLQQLDVVVFDIETTGFFPEQGDEMISIGAIKLIGGKMLAEQSFYSLIRCERELSSTIVNLTGIIIEQLKEAPSLSDVLIQFFGFVQNATLVAHHANHEKSFLQSANWKLFRTPFRYRIVDTSFLIGLQNLI